MLQEILITRLKMFEDDYRIYKKSIVNQRNAKLNIIDDQLKLYKQWKEKKQACICCATNFHFYNQISYIVPIISKNNFISWSKD